MRAYRRHQEAAWEFGEEWIVLLYGYLAELVGGGAQEKRTIPQRDAARVLLHAFLESGPKAFARLRGQWSVVLIQRSGRHAFFAKDYPGTRPLYWRRGPGRLWFSTEPGPLWRVDGPCTPCWSQLEAYLRPETPADRTVVEEVRRIEPGTVSRLSVEDAAGTSPSPLTFVANHWEPRLTRPKGTRGGRASKDLLEALSTAVRRAMPDGSFAVAFSGGVDSTTILALSAMHAGPTALERVRPLSLRFPRNPRCDEGYYIVPVVRALGLTPIDIEIHSPLTLDDLRGLYRRIHSPAFPNVPLIERLFSKAADEGLPVVLSGVGGDHVLDGHPVCLLDLMGSGRWKAACSMTSQMWIDGDAWAPRLAKLVLSGLLTAVLPRSLHEKLFRGSSSSSCPPNTLEKQTILRALDRERRHYHFDAQAELAEEMGIEVREPFFDRDLIGLVLALEPGELMLGGARRGLARSSVSDLLPRGVFFREGKTDLTEVSAPAWQEWPSSRARRASRRLSTNRRGASSVTASQNGAGLDRDVATLEVFWNEKFSGHSPGPVSQRVVTVPTRGLTRAHCCV